MKAIYKFELKVSEDVILNIDPNAKFLHISIQNNKPVVWFEVNITVPKEYRRVYQFETGQTIVKENLEYLGTLLFHNDQYVSHYYLDRNEKWTSF